MKRHSSTALSRRNPNLISKLAIRLVALTAAISFFGAGTAFAQSVVTGRVSDSSGAPVAGVTVMVKGGSAVGITDSNGNYSISAPAPDAVLTYQMVGHKTIDHMVGNQSVINVVLEAEATAIDQVVVTALGLLRKEKSLPYSTAIVKGDELSRVKDPNFINALAGKTAGVTINRSSAGAGGSVKVQIRGSRSIQDRGNEPLYVIDGMPINNTSYTSTLSTIGGGNNDGSRDTGDGVSSLNPDDIESMNILKGPAAAALYGAKAANGVVIISTKKGRVGRAEVTFSNNTTFDAAVHGRPEFQNNYGGVASSWGDPVNQKVDYLKKFFQTGVTTTNSISLSAGNDMMQTYFSYANLYARGVVPGNDLRKHNFNFRETADFFNKHLKVDANITLMYQEQKNPINAGAFYMNPLVGLYRFPRGGSIQGDASKTFDYFKENYEVYNAERNLKTQNWHNLSEWEQNPYWLIRRQLANDRRFRSMANLSLKWTFNPYLSIQARGNADYDSSFFENRMYASTAPALVGMGNTANGRYKIDQRYGLHLYGDLMLAYQRTFGDWGMSATVGSSIEGGHYRTQGIDSYTTGLVQANAFDVNAIISPAHPTASLNRQAQEQSLFFAGQLSWRDQLFLDVTARNDWSSTLAHTKHEKSGFFYPSIGLSWLANQTLGLGEKINMLKLRAAVSKVGNGLPAGASRSEGYYDNLGNWVYPQTEPYDELCPEMTTALETGLELRMFNSRFEFDFTWYRTDTRDQLFRLRAPAGKPYPYYYVNAGHIRNSGVEVMLAGSPVMTRNVVWRTGFNFAANRNKVIRLHDELRSFTFGESGSNSYEMRLEEGGSFGDIYGARFERDKDGNIIYGTEDKLPVSSGNQLYKIGNSSPKFNLSWTNTITWKSLSLNFLIDGRFGGKVMSMTQADLDAYGVSKRTGSDRDRGYAELEGKRFEGSAAIKALYERLGSRNGITEHYMYDATNIRLRELSLGYSLPAKWFERVGWIKGADVSVVGRNLFFFMNNAPYDPDAVMSTGNNLQGVDCYSMPSLRSVGFNVKLKF